MTVKTINLDKDTTNLLEQLRERDKDFNFSLFIRKHLEMEGSGKSESQETIISQRINEAKFSIKVAENNLALWEERFKTYKEEQKAKAIEVEKRRKENDEQREYNKKFDKMQESLHKYFMDKGYDEYKKGVKEGKWKSTIEFYHKFLEVKDG